MRERLHGEGLRLRLLASFVAVAAAAVAAFAALTLAQGRADVATLVDRRQDETAAAVVALLADGFKAQGGWALADVRAARALALSRGAVLEVQDAAGATLRTGLGMGGMGMMGAGADAPAGAALGDPRSEPVWVDGAVVGTAVLRFATGALPPAEKQLRDALARTTWLGILIAAAVALGAGAVVAGWITRPLRRLTAGVRRMHAGDRSVRVGAAGPGEIGELGRAIDGMAAALEREDELRVAVTAEVAHELRTPVAILAGQCEAMLDGVIEAGPEQIASLHDEVVRLGRVIEDLERLTAAKAARVAMRNEPCDLGAVARSVADSLRVEAEQAGVALRVEAGHAPVTGDADRLAQVARNLLANALKFTPPGGEVAVTVEATGGRARLRVDDTGIGIDEADLPHVFERFRRGGNAAGTPGRGVGLAIVAELVDAHGGTVAVERRRPAGTAFTVELPLA